MTVTMLARDLIRADIVVEADIELCATPLPVKARRASVPLRPHAPSMCSRSREKSALAAASARVILKGRERAHAEGATLKKL